LNVITGHVVQMFNMFMYPFGHAAEFGLIIGLNVLSSSEFDCSLFNLILF
jgi:hypothetical protein